MMDIPDRLKEYACADYFASALAADGLWDEEAQLWLIEPVDRIAENSEVGFLQVGRPGVDSIGFGYRKSRSGFWAYHRMEKRFQLLADSISQFLDGWQSGRISI